MESEEQLPAQNNIHTQYIDTESGTAIAGDVSIQGDFAGRDKIIHDEVVHGDKVMGDKVVMNEAPKPRIPLQRPPRVEYFQDRKDDLAQILVNLQPGRVVTICGPGGMGKSALAAEVLWHLAPGNAPPQLVPDGILFHSFYDKGQSDLALEHIALSFGEEVRPTPKEAAQRALSGRIVLLLLDGTEEADDLRPILEIRNRCGVLITSRV